MQTKLNERKGKNQPSNLVELSLWHVICMLLKLVWHIFMLFIKKVIRLGGGGTLRYNKLLAVCSIIFFSFRISLLLSLQKLLSSFIFLGVYIFSSHYCDGIMGCNLMDACVIRCSADERTTSSIFLRYLWVRPIDPRVFAIKFGPSSRTMDPKKIFWLFIIRMCDYLDRTSVRK